jgi:hypothetical protein
LEGNAMAKVFRVTLTGSQEVPANGSAASGLGTVVFDDAAVAASYSIRYTGLDFGPAFGLPAQTPTTADDVINHHVHNAPRGVNGSVVFGQITPAQDNDDLAAVLNADGSWTISGRWEITDPASTPLSTFAGDLASAQVGSDVSLYFNAHTPPFPGGEIRGQWVAIADEDINPLVDDGFYLTTYHDVLAAGVDADQHYSQIGWREGRNPNAFFSTNGYLSANADVDAANINPLDHYHQFGWREGRDPSVNFDTTLYLQNNPDVQAASINPLEHYLAFGQSEGRQIYAAIGGNIQGTFDAEFYLLANPDVGAAGLDAAFHFQTFGWREGRDPNAYFDTSAYLAAYTDVAAASVNPLEHYHNFGWREGRDPSASFNTSSYLAAYPDVAVAQIDPLLHFLQFGIYEGRQAFGDAIIG